MGEFHSIILLTDKITMYAAGENNDGRLALGSTNNDKHFTFTKITNLANLPKNYSIV